MLSFQLFQWFHKFQSFRPAFILPQTRGRTGAGQEAYSLEHQPSSMFRRRMMRIRKRDRDG
jgi:hypothetical protein